MINVTDLFPDDAPVDETAYCILLIIEESDKTMWKRSMARELNNWRESGRCPLNIMETVSVQTICRRIDTLEDEGFLDSNPTYSDNLGRYVEAYTVTEKGMEALSAIHDAMITTLYVELFEHSLEEESIVLKDGVLEKLHRYTGQDLGSTIDQLERSFSEVAAVELPDVSIRA